MTEFNAGTFNAGLEAAARWHEQQARDCRSIASVNQDNDLGSDCETHAIDHDIAAEEIRALSTPAPQVEREAIQSIYSKLAEEGGGTWATYMMMDIEQAYGALGSRDEQAIRADEREKQKEIDAKIAEGSLYNEKYRGVAGHNWYHIKQPGSDNAYGNGRLDAAAAIRESGGAR